MHAASKRFVSVANSRLQLIPPLLQPRRVQAQPKAAAAAAAQQPLGPASAKNKPDWVRILEEDAAVDEEVAELLQGTDGDPDKIRAKMEQKLRSPFGSSPGGSSAAGPSTGPSSSAGPAGLPFEARTGSDTPPHITFRELDPFDLWVWLEFVVPPAQREKELLQSTLKSWFVVGKLGGFNSQNMQVYYNNSDDNSFLEYDSEEAASALSAFMHSCSDAEFKGSWARFHVDLGTADEVALDVLLNMLAGFSFEVAGLSRIMVGGEHERWEVPPRIDAEEELGWGEGQQEDSSDGRPKRQHGQAPKVGINPMKLPQGLEEELEMLDELGLMYDQQQQQQQPQQQQSQQPQQRREWGKGLKSLGGTGAAAARGSILGSQQQKQQQQRPPPGPGQPAGGAGSSSSRGGSERAQQLEQLRKLQQLEQGAAGPGMTVYSEEEFRRAFGVMGDDDNDSEAAA